MCDYCRGNALSQRELKGDAYEGLEMEIEGDALCVCVVAPIKIGYIVAHTVYEKR